MYKTKKKYTNSINQRNKNSKLKKSKKGGGNRSDAAKGVAGDIKGSIVQGFKNMENPIVFLYQLIEQHVFGWDVQKQIKVQRQPKHKPVGVKDFLRGQVPEYEKKALQKETEAEAEKQYAAAEAAQAAKSSAQSAAKLPVRGGNPMKVKLSLKKNIKKSSHK